MAFLERLKEAMIKFTNLIPDSVEGEAILRDKFLTQSAPDIKRKLQKLVSEPGKFNLESLLQASNSVYNNRDLEQEKQKEKHHGEILTAMRMGVNSPKTQARVCFQCGKPGHFRRECPQLGEKKRPPRPCPQCKGNHWKSECPQVCRDLESSSPDSQ